MKTKIVLLLLVFSLSITAQKKREKLSSYTDANGNEYVLGQEIILNTGSRDDASFNHVFLNSISGYGNAGSHLANQKFKIGIIMRKNTKSRKEVEITAIRGLITVVIDADNASRSGEIGNLINQKNLTVIEKSDKYDKLKKIKELFDAGVLTKDEYEKEKKEVLKN